MIYKWSTRRLIVWATDSYLFLSVPVILHYETFLLLIVNFFSVNQRVNSVGEKIITVI